MTFDEYATILAVHGRRVANRAVLSTQPLDQRSLDDFHDCYGPECDLPEHERGMTSLSDTYDPTGRLQAHYSHTAPPIIGTDEKGNACYWPEPGSDLAELAAGDEAQEDGAA